MSNPQRISDPKTRKFSRILCRYCAIDLLSASSDGTCDIAQFIQCLMPCWFETIIYIKTYDKMNSVFW